MVALVWSSEAIFRSFSEGQVKKGQIFKFINVDKKGTYLDQFWLRNLMVSFFCVRPPEVTKITFEKMTSYMGMISETKTLHLGVKN